MISEYEMGKFSLIALLHIATNQWDVQMGYHQDITKGMNPHVNYESSTLGGLKEAPPARKDHTPYYNAALVRARIEKQNNFQQAGETYRNFEYWERDELITNLVSTLAPVKKHIQNKMVEMFTACKENYGRRVAESLKLRSGDGKVKSAEQTAQQVERVSKEFDPY